MYAGTGSGEGTKDKLVSWKLEIVRDSFAFTECKETVNRVAIIGQRRVRLTML